MSEACHTPHPCGLPDLNVVGVGADNLVELLRRLPRVEELLQDMADIAPCVSPSASMPGLVELTPGLGTVIESIRIWLFRQIKLAHRALEVSQPDNPLDRENRAYELLRFEATHGGEFIKIAGLALQLEAEGRAAS